MPGLGLLLAGLAASIAALIFAAVIYTAESQGPRRD